MYQRATRGRSRRGVCASCSATRSFPRRSPSCLRRPPPPGSTTAAARAGAAGGRRARRRARRALVDGHDGVGARRGDGPAPGAAGRSSRGDLRRFSAGRLVASVGRDHHAPLAYARERRPVRRGVDEPATLRPRGAPGRARSARSAPASVTTAAPGRPPARRRGRRPPRARPRVRAAVAGPQRWRSFRLDPLRCHQPRRSSTALDGRGRPADAPARAVLVDLYGRRGWCANGIVPARRCSDCAASARRAARSRRALARDLRASTSCATPTAQWRVVHDLTDAPSGARFARSWSAASSPGCCRTRRDWRASPRSTSTSRPASGAARLRRARRSAQPALVVLTPGPASPHLRRALVPRQAARLPPRRGRRSGRARGPAVAAGAARLRAGRRRLPPGRGCGARSARVAHGEGARRRASPAVASGRAAGRRSRCRANSPGSAVGEGLAASPARAGAATRHRGRRPLVQLQRIDGIRTTVLGRTREGVDRRRARRRARVEVVVRLQASRGDSDGVAVMPGGRRAARAARWSAGRAAGRRAVLARTCGCCDGHRARRTAPRSDVAVPQVDLCASLPSAPPMRCSGSGAPPSGPRPRRARLARIARPARSGPDDRRRVARAWRDGVAGAAARRRA